jgi:hypothetical protein
MKFTRQFFWEGGSGTHTLELVSLDQARKVARSAAEFRDDLPVHSFSITSEDGSTERWFHLDGDWRQLH